VVSDTATTSSVTSQAVSTFTKACYDGHSQPNVPPVSRPYRSESMTDLIVVLHARWYQIEFCSCESP